MTTKRKVRTTLRSKKTTSTPSALPWHATKTVLFDADNLSVILNGQHILTNVSACIHQGEFIGLIGPNGAGKTTLLRLLSGFQEASKGSLKRKPGLKIGYVPQHGLSAERMIPVSVLEVVRLAAASKTAAVEALVATGMEGQAHKRFRELSGGQQQRVLIAKALAAKPDILFLDEPTTGIDAGSEELFYELLKQLHGQGLTIVLISHDLEAVLSLVGRVICLNNHVLYDGPAEHFEPDMYTTVFNTRHRLLHHQHHHERAETTHA